MRPLRALLSLVFVCLAVSLPARAHLGGKDIYEDASVGPYKLYVTVRPPVVIPGAAAIEIRSAGAPLTSLAVTPMPMQGEGTQYAPKADVLRQSPADKSFYTGEVWLMRQGSWKLQIAVAGAAGNRTSAVPVPSVALSASTMPRGTGDLLLALGALLVIGLLAIVVAAARESRLLPEQIAIDGWARSAAAGAAALFCVTVFLLVGARWWRVSAAASLQGVYKPILVSQSLHGSALDLYLKEGSSVDGLSLGDLIPDHGHLMHLYVVREPEMDVVFHLHPKQLAPGNFHLLLPSLPPGEYAFYGDIVHANGFPETMTSRLIVPAAMRGLPLTGDDAEANPRPLRAGMLGPEDKLPDGYTMVWKQPQSVGANTAYQFQFQLLARDGKPAIDVVPYMGMAGHAAFIKTDGSAFAHVHPEGSAAMAAMMLANESPMPSKAMPMPMQMAEGRSQTSHESLSSIVSFPYGFPAPGRYRIFVQMKHGSTIETGVFDASVSK